MKIITQTPGPGGAYPPIQEGNFASVPEAELLFINPPNDKVSKSSSRLKCAAPNLEHTIDAARFAKMQASFISYVDYVVLMEDDTPEYIISQLHPDIVVKGKDWENKYIPERELIESYGGKLCFAEMEGGSNYQNISLFPGLFKRRKMSCMKQVKTAVSKNNLLSLSFFFFHKSYSLKNRAAFVLKKG